MSLLRGGTHPGQKGKDSIVVRAIRRTVTHMEEFTNKTFLILMSLIFPVLLLASAVYLQSNICVIISIFVWIGVGVTIMYLPQTEN